MGTGTLQAGKYRVSVSATFVISAADWLEWERALKKASEILFNASQGQLQFGTFYVADDSVGLDTADLVLYPAGDPAFASGQFGQPGAAIHLMPYVKNGVLTVLHEWGHHAWALGEEYSAPLFFDTIDTSAPAPDSSTIPITGATWADDELVTLGAAAVLRIASKAERQTVSANTATRVTCAAPFSVLPTSADTTTVAYQTPAECAAAIGQNFCIMEKSRRAAGQFDGNGVWVPAPNAVTEFCTPSNHDPDQDTQHEGKFGTSCWETIQATPGYANLVTPDPAPAGPVAGFTVPDWIVLDRRPRFAVVLDRSGSMSAGTRIADARHGAIYWLEFCAQGSDLLTIVWYDHARDRVLDLTEVQTLASVAPTIGAINALTPRGSTNIRDGLYAALDQIQSLPTRAAVQVALLLTDGIHNTPFGSQAVEVIPDFQDAGCRIYTLGAGSPAAVDMDALDALAESTGGRSYAVGDSAQGAIETAMVEINAEVRGGIITTQPNLMPDAKDADIEVRLRELGAYDRRLPLGRLLERLGLGEVGDLGRLPGALARLVATIAAEVEEGCERVSFTLVHPEGEALWLYLVTPRGEALDLTGAGVRRVISAAPHEFAIVERPEPGVWLMVAVRARAGGAFPFQAVAGGENRRLQVYGGAPPQNPEGAPVRLWAMGRWQQPLTGLRVTARVTDPTGRRHHLTLTDDADEPATGRYEATFKPPAPGRYRAEVTVRSTGAALLALPLHRALHLEEGQALSLQTDAPPFTRVVRFYFDVGGRAKVEDREAREGLVEKLQPRRGRPIRLESAPRTIDGAHRKTTT